MKFSDWQNFLIYLLTTVLYILYNPIHRLSVSDRGINLSFLDALYIIAPVPLFIKGWCCDWPPTLVLKQWCLKGSLSSSVKVIVIQRSVRLGWKQRLGVVRYIFKTQLMFKQISHPLWWEVNVCRTRTKLSWKKNRLMQCFKDKSESINLTGLHYFKYTWDLTAQSPAESFHWPTFRHKAFVKVWTCLCLFWLLHYFLRLY